MSLNLIKISLEAKKKKIREVCTEFRMELGMIEILKVIKFHTTEQLRKRFKLTKSKRHLN